MGKERREREEEHSGFRLLVGSLFQHAIATVDSLIRRGVAITVTDENGPSYAPIRMANKRPKDLDSLII